MTPSLTEPAIVENPLAEAVAEFPENFAFSTTGASWMTYIFINADGLFSGDFYSAHDVPGPGYGADVNESLFR